MNFVFDLDGTICFKGRPVSDEISDCLVKLTKQGHQVIFASARPIRDMLPVLREDLHHYTMIGGNGSLVYKQGKIINTVAFTAEEASSIVRLINEYDATYLIDSDWDYAYTGSSDHPILQNLDSAKLAKLVDFDSLKSIVKVLILTSKNNDLLTTELSKLNVHINKHTNENVLDISPKGTHKWSALQLLGIDEKAYVAFGNDANDITMFEHALHPVMIGHHDQLITFAQESITIVENLEAKIVAKLEELSDKFSGIEV